ncbi:MAG: tetratricopeptide repeat protein [Deltaproteobacteria bacterium]|nr:tetratricopeptide repeat protein [Deltaproteobacteria bacterium]
MSEASKPLDLVDAAERSFLGGLTHDAISILYQALNAEPDDFRALRSLGVIFHSLGRFSEALDTLEAAVKANEHDCEARLDLALTCYSLKEHGRARDELERLLVKYPNEYRYWSALSAVEEAMAQTLQGTPTRHSVFLRPSTGELSARQGLGDEGPFDPDRAMQEDMIRRCTDRDRKTLAVFLTVASGPELDVLSVGLSEYFDLRRVMSFKYDVYQQAAREADIVWLEGLAEDMACFLREADILEGKKVCVRLSREDILLGAARKVSFARADAIFFESFCLRDLFLSGNPDVRNGTALEVILRAVDTRSYTYLPRHGTRKIAASVPASLDKGEFLLLLEAYLAIHRAYSDAELHLSVGLRNMTNEQHVQQFLTENGCGYSVFFHGHGEELKAFLNSCHYYLSAETYSGAPGAVEALLLGLKPLIRSSPGASELYPECCLWRHLGEVLPLYENPPDTVKISGLLRDIHRPSAVIHQYIYRFIGLQWL